MDPELQVLGIQLTNAAVRNTASAVADKIGAAKARQKDKDTIAELEDIVSGLLDDKNELLRIAQAFEQEMVAQRISESDIRYMTENLVPRLQELVSVTASDETLDETMQSMIDILQPIISVETLTVLQLIGFNFRKAIGEPLTDLLARLIKSRATADVNADKELQRLRLEHEVMFLKVIQDADASARLRELSNRS